MHKSSATHDSTQAYWQQSIGNGMLGCRLQTKARKHLQAQQWGLAVKDYATALEVADTMLQAPHTQKFAIERYLRTALELIYAMRKYKPNTDLGELIETVKQRLQPLLAPVPAEVVIAPLIDVAFSPIDDVDDWIQMLFNYELSGQTLPH
ncbi:hypothetical protein KO507_15100 [Gilvimarinus agarilyticus]|uniref:hypothetical protein n=1 Tax=unclassified Gilvimarinus TaxID=2642066 RepID=UPI001C09319A|nr:MULTISPECIES: hypothetical protein [unclassified Gilvimarinus]MBU2887095.1 hypothetical protein [Gilvimarinus agarilyticus]MDO6571754.1 hypothetical protein [Gilvimarinus sp. 2_MG-2023]MDO6745826.1 hypothetical protein [Gilvimarinus sp. 1_MG-2023]